MDKKARFYELLEQDPYKMHKKLIVLGYCRALQAWVRDVAIKSGLTLAVLPVWQKDIQRWKDIARAYGGKLVDNDDVKQVIKKMPQGLREKCAHLRSACICERGETEYMRGACLVRDDKMDHKEREAYTTIINGYNRAMKKRAEQKGLPFISVAQWMKDNQ